MGQKAIIIGATSGIGLELARLYIERGWEVGLCGRREDRLCEIRNKYGSDKVHIKAMDIREENAGEILDTLLEEIPLPDLLIHVSGIGKQNHSLKEDLEINTIRTNCEGMVRIVDHFVNYIREHQTEVGYNKDKRAQIAVVTSVAGTAGLGTAPAYSASKTMQSTYISALVQLCNMEKIPVDFTDIKPGFVKTDLLDPNKHYPLMISTKKAGELIVKALDKKKRCYIFDWRYKLLVLFWKCIPRCIWEKVTIVKN